MAACVGVAMAALRASAPKQITHNQVTFSHLSQPPSPSPDGFRPRCVHALLAAGDTVNVNSPGGNAEGSSFVGRIATASWSTLMPEDCSLISCCCEVEPTRPERLFLIQLFVKKTDTCTSADHPWIEVDQVDKLAITGIEQVAETPYYVWIPIDLVTDVVFICAIQDFTNQTFGPLHGRRDAFAVTARANYIIDERVNLIRPRFSAIGFEEDNGTDQNSCPASSVLGMVPYTVRMLQMLQAHTTSDIKLTTNNSKIGMYAQRVTTFIGEEGIDYLTKKITNNVPNATADISSNRTTLRNCIMPGLAVRATVMPLRTTSYTFENNDQFDDVGRIFCSTHGSGTKRKVDSKADIALLTGKTKTYNVYMGDTLNSAYFDPHRSNDDDELEYGPRINGDRVKNQRKCRYMKLTFDHSTQTLKYTLKVVPVEAWRGSLAVRECLRHNKIRLFSSKSSLSTRSGTQSTDLRVNSVVVFENALWTIIEINQELRSATLRATDGSRRVVNNICLSTLVLMNV